MIKLRKVLVLIILLISVVKDETQAALYNYGSQSIKGNLIRTNSPAPKASGLEMSGEVLSKNKPMRTYRRKAHEEKSNKRIKANFSDVLMMKLISYYENKYKVQNNVPARMPVIFSKDAKSKNRMGKRITFSVPEVVIV